MIQQLESWIKTHGLTGTQLKILAIAAMFIDHLGAICFPDSIAFRVIGRISFPIFCFLISEGAYHTSNIRKYEMRLFLFALLSEIPFDLAFYGRILYWEHQNVFFTLLAGLLCIDVIQHQSRSRGLVAFMILAVITQISNTDYGAAGVLFVLLFYLYRNRPIQGQLLFGITNYFCFFSPLQACAGFASIPLLFYSGKPGRRMRWLFYLFYPLHLLLLAGIKRFL
ncbi:MAG: TraX family protein [Lachnospiraceae bacterium]